MNDIRTKVLQKIFKQLFIIKKDLANGSYDVNHFNFNLLEFSYYFEKTGKPDLETLFKQIEKVIKILVKYFDTI